MHNECPRKSEFGHFVIYTHSIKCGLIQRGLKKKAKVGPLNTKPTKTCDICRALGPLKLISPALKSLLIFLGNQVVFNGLYFGHPISKSQFFWGLLYLILKYDSNYIDLAFIFHLYQKMYCLEPIFFVFPKTNGCFKAIVQCPIEDTMNSVVVFNISLQINY